MVKIQRFFVFLHKKLETKVICVNHYCYLELECKRYSLSH